MATGKYVANPGGLRRSGEMMESLPERTKRMGENFIRDAHYFRDFAGKTDDFARGVLPKFDANNDSCLEMVRALGSAFVGLQEAVWANGQHIEGVQSYAKEQIGRQTSSLDGPGEDSDGGGKH
ncbi:hypothetical protein ACFVQ0_16970 [Streptomyces sp. NPDC057900]|uniref:hypothetical protein n=1 Tax=Streptomyces sp. NPDC057900 TaxID=3346274 RepID=UPI0036DFFCE5